MFLKINIFLFFILISSLVFLIKGIEIKSSTITNKNVNVLGVDLSYALIDVEFDKSELYRYDTLSCPNFECEPLDNPLVDCSCDYTNIADCPKSIGRDPSCQPCPNTVDGEDVCKGNWTVMDFNDKRVFSTSTSMDFRVKAPFGCKGISLKVNSIVGLGPTYIGAVTTTWKLRYSSSVVPQRNVLFNICPSDEWDPDVHYTFTKSWTRDTYFFTVSAAPNTNFTFSLELMEYDVPNNTIGSNCQNVTEYHQCITTGEVMYGQADNLQYVYYSYEVTKAGNYFFNAPSIFQSTAFYISKDSNNQYPISGNNNWELTEEFDNYLYFYLEPISDNQPLILYITAVSTYATNFTFSITTEGIAKPYSVGSLNSPEEGSFALTSTSRLILPDGKVLPYSSYSSSSSYTVLFPQENINPLYPVPQYFYGSAKFDFRKIYNNITTYNKFKSNSYQSAVLLSSSIGKTNIVRYFEFDDIVNSKIEFLSTIFDDSGTALNNILELSEKEILCNGTDFNQILQLVKETQNILFNVTNVDELNNYRYGLDSLTMSDSWVGCSNQAVQLLEMNTVVKNVSIKFCPYNVNDTEYYNDPCCSSLASYYQCCNPREISLNFNVYSNGNKDLVDEQCSSLDCTLSVLSEYGKSLSNIEQCSVAANEPDRIKLDSITVLRQCKDVLVSPYCTNDTECLEYGGENSVCDVYNRKCSPDFEYIDKKYIGCVLGSLPKTVLFSFLQGSIKIDDQVIQSVYQGNQRDDCVGSTTITDREYVKWHSEFINVKECYPITNCLDATCLTHHDTCLEGIYTEWHLSLVSSADNCTINGICTSDNSISNVDDCDTDTEFCGACPNEGLPCFSALDAYPDQTACQGQSICLLPNGDYKTNLTKEQCEQDTFTCTGYCGYTCNSRLTPSQPANCLIISKNMTQTKCLALGNTAWSSSLSQCYLVSATEQQCKDQSYTWLDCSTRSEGECMGITGTNINLCRLLPIECTTQQECESAGECSDVYYFDPNSGSNVYYPYGAGKCVFKHGSYQFGITCDDRDGSSQNDSPNGCYAHKPKYINKNDCENAGGKWWVQSLNQSTCESQIGCQVLEDQFVVTNLPYNYYFNEMTEEQCTGCYESFNQWTNKFKWTKAKWLPGVYSNVEWKTTEFIPKKNGSQFSYQIFYKNIMSSTNTLIADLFRSEAYCRFQQLQSNLNSITCSCSTIDNYNNGDVSTCFEKSSPLLGLSKPCNGEQSKFSFDFGFIEFLNGSIESSCQTISVYLQSKELYTSTQPESLASNFVSYSKPDRYGIVNDNDAIIGTLLSDGIIIKSQDGLQETKICFVLESGIEESSKYPQFDFALQLNYQSTPVPLEVVTWFEKNNETSDTLLCSNISTIPNNDPIYFPINRLSHWKDQYKQVFDQTSRGLMYTLASVFIIITVWGLFEISLIIYNQYTSTGKKNFQLIHLLICIVTLFILIRAIYFFIMPSGVLADSPVADYILVVLPTFIYFTAFTIIIILWYVIVFLVLKKNRSAESLTKRLYVTVVIINSILYILFVIIVLVFQFTKQNNSSNDCGSRIAIAVESTTPQRVVSIVYAVIQGAISLIIGAAFIYLGSSLYSAMKVTNIKVGSKTNHQRKIFTLTLTCSISFILHCCFVLVMVAANVNSIVFSFICLLITEALPAVSILYSFDQRNPYQSRDDSTTKTSGFSKNRVTSIGIGSSTERQSHNSNSSSSSYNTPPITSMDVDSSNVTP